MNRHSRVSAIVRATTDFDEDGERRNKRSAILDKFEKNLERQVDFRFDAATLVRHQLSNNLLQRHKNEYRDERTGVWNS